MGQCHDRDEAVRDAPVLSISLGDSAVFRIPGGGINLILRRVTLLPSR